MQYYQEPDQDFGARAYDQDPEQDRPRPPEQDKLVRYTGGMDYAQGGGMAQPQQPQTFSQMQKAGRARPPMQMMNLGQWGGMMRPPSGAQAPRPAGLPNIPGFANAFQRLQANRAGAQSGPRVPMLNGITDLRNRIQTKRDEATAPAAPAAPAAPTQTQPTNGFDPMEWFRQQVMGGSDDALKRSQAYLGGQIDDQFNLKEQQLRDEMAARGLGDSTVYGGRMQDLNVGRRSAQSDLGERLALDDLERKRGMVQNMANLDENTRQYLLQLLNVGYGG